MFIAKTPVAAGTSSNPTTFTHAEEQSTFFVSQTATKSLSPGGCMFRDCFVCSLPATGLFGHNSTLTRVQLRKLHRWSTKEAQPSVVRAATHETILSSKFLDDPGGSQIRTEKKGRRRWRRWRLQRFAEICRVCFKLHCRRVGRS